MTNDRERDNAGEAKNRKTPNRTDQDNRKEKPSSSKPDDTIEGEGSPGLTITGGGGHA
jgi:hypothetical protein